MSSFSFDALLAIFFILSLDKLRSSNSFSASMHISKPLDSSFKPSWSSLLSCSVDQSFCKLSISFLVFLMSLAGSPPLLLSWNVARTSTNLAEKTFISSALTNACVGNFETLFALCFSLGSTLRFGAACDGADDEFIPLVATAEITVSAALVKAFVIPSTNCIPTRSHPLGMESTAFSHCAFASLTCLVSLSCSSFALSISSRTDFSLVKAISLFVCSSTWVFWKCPLAAEETSSSSPVRCITFSNLLSTAFANSKDSEAFSSIFLSSMGRMSFTSSLLPETRVRTTFFTCSGTFAE